MNKLAKSLLVVALLSGGAVSAQKVQTASQRQVEIAATVEQSPSFPVSGNERFHYQKSEIPRTSYQKRSSRQGISFLCC